MLVFPSAELIGAVEQVIYEEYYEVDIEMHFKWRSQKARFEEVVDQKALESAR